MVRNNLWSDLALMLGVGALYTNLPVNLVRFYNVPMPLAAAIGGLFFVPVLWYVVIHRNRFVVDKWFGYMLAFLGAMLVSSLFARDAMLALTEIGTFAFEGLCLYLLVLNGVRTPETFRRVAWTILLCAALIGTLTLYQKVTHDYTNEFGGLSQHTQLNTHDRAFVTERAQGQVAEQNRFAQTLLVLLPLGFFGMMTRTGRGRFALAITTALIAGGVVMSYSRGAFLAVAVMIGLAILFRFVRARTVLIPVATAVLAIGLLAPDYVERVGTMAGLRGFIDNDPSKAPEPVLQNRATEMLAAFHVAQDHPVFGVGPGQYVPFYSMDYQLNPDIAYRFIPRQREAHSLYFGMAAEIGVVGVGVFLAIMGLIMVDLYRRGRDLAAAGQAGSPVVFALWLGLVGYFVSGLFLHLAYQRYFWLLIALAGALMQIYKTENNPQCSES